MQAVSTPVSFRCAHQAAAMLAFLSIYHRVSRRKFSSKHPDEFIPAPWVLSTLTASMSMSSPLLSEKARPAAPAVPLALKTKKPAAGGGAAGFPKRTERRPGGGVPPFRQTPLGRRSGSSEIEAMREELHRFDEDQDTHSRRPLNRLCCSAAMRKMHDLLEQKSPAWRLAVCQTQKRPRHQRAYRHSNGLETAA